MKNKYWMALGVTLAVLTGCHDNDEGGSTDIDRQILVLSAGMESGTVGTRAGSTNFPNDGVIAVTAAYYTGAGTATDWTSYSDIQNARAETDQDLSSGATYTFAWDTPRYWPFNGSELVFIAYSPQAVAGSGVELIDATNLRLTLREDMPDVMYASVNATAADYPYSKADQDINYSTVNLGEFRHALSQVSVRVTADASMNPDVELVGVQLKTTRPFATLDLLGGDTGLLVGTDRQDFVWDLLSGASYAFYSADYTGLAMFYPGTEADTSLLITLQDGPLTVTWEFGVEEFLIGSTTDAVTFRRAQRAELVVTVRGVDVINPNDAVTLQGILADWVDRGDYRIVIN